MKKIDSNYAIQYRGKLKDYNLNNYIHSSDNGYWEAEGVQVNEANNFPFSDVTTIANYNSTLQIPDELLDIERHLRRVRRTRNIKERIIRLDFSDDMNEVTNYPVEDNYWNNDVLPPADYYPVKGILEVQSDNDLTIQTFHRLPDGSVWTRSYDNNTKSWTTWASEVPSILKEDEAVKSYNSTYNSYSQARYMESGYERGYTGYSPLNNHNYSVDTLSGISKRQLYQGKIKTKDGKEIDELSILNHFNKFNGTMTDIELLQYIHKKVVDYINERFTKNKATRPQGSYITLGNTVLDIPEFYSKDEFTKEFKASQGETPSKYILKRSGRLPNVAIPPVVRSKFYLKNNNLDLERIFKVWKREPDIPMSVAEIEGGVWTRNNLANMSINNPFLIKNTENFTPDGRVFTFELFGKDIPLLYNDDRGFMRNYLNRNTNNMRNNHPIEWSSYHKPLLKDKGILQGVVSTILDLYGYKYGDPSPIIGGRTGVPEYRFEVPNTKKMYDKIGTYIEDDNSFEDYRDLVSAITLKVERVNEGTPSESFLSSTDYIYIQVDNYFENRVFPISGYNSKFTNGNFIERGIRVTYKKGDNNLDYIYVYAVYDKSYAFRFEVIVEQ